MRERKAMFLIGSPMCTAFSRLQNLNFRRMTPEKVQEIIQYGMNHLEFCMYLYKIQVEQGLYFLHEHPASATSWDTDCVKNILRLPNVRRIDSDMCAFGMTQYDSEGPGLIKKPTGFMSNSPEILKQLYRRCTGGHRHILLLNGRAQRAQVYPDELCKLILVGLVNQMKSDGRIEDHLINNKNFIAS